VGVYVTVQLGKLSLHQTEASQPVEPLPELTAQQIADEISTEENFQIQITKLEEQLNHMKPNLAAITEYRKKVSLLSKGALTRKIGEQSCIAAYAW